MPRKRGSLSSPALALGACPSGVVNIGCGTIAHEEASFALVNHSLDAQIRRRSMPRMRYSGKDRAARTLLDAGFERPRCDHLSAPEDATRSCTKPVSSRRTNYAVPSGGVSVAEKRLWIGPALRYP